MSSGMFKNTAPCLELLKMFPLTDDDRSHVSSHSNGHFRDRVPLVKGAPNSWMVVLSFLTTNLTSFLSASKAGPK